MSAALSTTVAGVINAALTQGLTAPGIATALESAQLLLEPEKAAEFEKLLRWHREDATTIERLQAQVAELEAQRAALAVRLRAGQRWRQGRTQPLVSQDYVSQDELRAIFGIKLTAPWEAPGEAPCRPCGCPKRFNRHSDGCPTLQGDDPFLLRHDYSKGRDLPESGGAS